MISVKADREFERTVQWYPGHMAAAMRRIGEYISLIDIVLEVVDARVPRIGSNPMLDAVLGKRARLRVLTREDLADPNENARWGTQFDREARPCVFVNGLRRASVSRIRPFLDAASSGAKKMQRVMVVGLPNSGKSSVINQLLGRAAARTEDRAGVTRSLQWFRVAPLLELMDTPGILVPKIETAEAQWKLALVGAVPRDRYDPTDIVARFNRWLGEGNGGKNTVPDLERFAAERGFVRKRGEIDYHNAAQSYIKDFNNGKFGRLTLERAPREPADDDA